MSTDTIELTALRPAVAARELSNTADPVWLAAFMRSLDLGAAQDDLARILEVWGLSQANAAELFGVSRQAVGKWLKRGLPADRLETVADLAAATDILVRFLKPGRIPAVVRRPAERLNGRSLLDLVREGRSRDALVACRRMFVFGSAQGE